MIPHRGAIQTQVQPCCQIVLQHCIPTPRGESYRREIPVSFQGERDENKADYSTRRNESAQRRGRIRRLERQVESSSHLGGTCSLALLFTFAKRKKKGCAHLLMIREHLPICTNYSSWKGNCPFVFDSILNNTKTGIYLLVAHEKEDHGHTSNFLRLTSSHNVHTRA